VKEYGAIKSLEAGDTPVEFVELVEHFSLRWIHIRLLVTHLTIQSCGGAVAKTAPFVFGSIRHEFGVASSEVVLLTSAVPFGAVFGMMVWASLNDSIGRRATLMVQTAGVGIMSLMFLLVPASAEKRYFLILVLIRAVTGFFSGPMIDLCLLHFTEFLPSLHRGFLVGIAGGGWSLGALCTIALDRALEGKTRLILACPALPCFVGFLALYFCPESPRFLYVTGREQEARDVVARVLASPLIVSSDTPGAVMEAPERVSIGKGTLVDTSHMPLYSRLLMLFLPRHLWTTTSMVALMMCLVAGCSSATAWFPTIFQKAFEEKRIPYNVFLLGECCEVLGIVLAALMLDRWGRKGVAVSALFGGVVAVSLLMRSQSLLALGSFYCIYESSLGAAWASVTTYSMEAFPTYLRGTAAGLSSVAGRAVMVAVPIFLGGILDRPGLPAVANGAKVVEGFMVSAFILGIVVVLMIRVDTANRKMEDL